MFIKLNALFGVLTFNRFQFVYIMSPQFFDATWHLLMFRGITSFGQDWIRKANIHCSLWDRKASPIDKVEKNHSSKKWSIFIYLVVSERLKIEVLTKYQLTQFQSMNKKYLPFDMF